MKQEFTADGPYLTTHQASKSGDWRRLTEFLPDSVLCPCSTIRQFLLELVCNGKKV